MMSRFPFSLENIPKQTSFACLSLKFGSILSALILTLYSIFGLASCLAALNSLPPHWSPEDTDVIFSYAVIIIVAITHAITLFLNTLMMVGVLKDKANLIKPWVIWSSLEVLVDLMVFVFWTTIGMIHHYGDITDFAIYVIQFLGLMVRFYMLMIVSSYYRQLEEITQEEREKLRDLITNENCPSIGMVLLWLNLFCAILSDVESFSVLSEADVRGSLHSRHGSARHCSAAGIGPHKYLSILSQTSSHTAM